MRAILPCCIALLAGSAAAQTAPTYPNPVPPQSLVSPTTPAPFEKGSFELLLMAPPAISDTVLDFRPHGVGIGQSTFAGDGIFGYIGLSGGVSYALTDLLAVGGAVSFEINGGDPTVGTSGVYEVEGEPFLKLNLGSVLKTGTFNPYVLGGFSFGVQGTTGQQGQAWGLFGVDVDPGVEWLFGGRWGVDVFVPLQFQFATHADSQVGLNLGLGYGLVGYL